MLRTETPWGEEETSYMLEMYRTTSNSFGVITRILNGKFGHGRTRNAVIGKINRMDKRNERPAAKRVVQRKPSAPRNPAPRKSKPFQGVAIHAAPVPSLPGDVGIEDLDGCRWPNGPLLERPPYTYCNAPRVDGSSWCSAHAARVFSPPPLRLARKKPTY